jgi:hypothetical protein
LAVFVGIGGCGGAAPPSAGMASAGAAPRIFPDYAATTIPPNIAPIRFVIEEPGAVFRTRIHGDHGAEIVVSRPDPSVPIPVAEWGRLLESNRGGVLRFEVTVQDPRGAWRRFEEFEVRVAPERVDDYLVYRRKLPGQDWRQTSIQIRQRALGSFDESVVLDNARIGTACINCHAFAGNKTRFMSLGFRHFLYGSGTLLAVDGKIEKIPVKFGFTAWHPSGDVVVFAQQTHLSQRGSWVEDSNLCYYRRATRTVRKIPGLSREDWHQDCATFSADGRELYASAGRKPWGATPTRNVPAEILRQIVPYDLVRVRFDIQKDEWSAPETMISSQETGKNIVFPRTSPDGRWLAVRMMDARTESGGSIHLVDLERARATGRFEPKECRELSVGDARGWHSWSSNGKWIVFSSSRETGIFIRPYLAYVDAEGRVHKPVLVPAENPSALGLDAFMYNVPELIDEPVRASARALARAIRSAKFLPVDVGAAAEK